jgi:hypothetical protein
MSSEKVLSRLLKKQSHEEALEKFFKTPKKEKAIVNRPGRPKLDQEKKARNFTLCLAPQYLDFLDRMTVKDPKIQGRGRKIRFIIDRFIEHERRSIEQLKVLRESLNEVQKTLSAFGGRVKKGEKLQLLNSEKLTITKKVDQVHTLLKILAYSPKTLARLLPRDEWAILSFCLDWKSNKGVKL